MACSYEGVVRFPGSNKDHKFRTLILKSVMMQLMRGQHTKKTRRKSANHCF